MNHTDFTAFHTAALDLLRRQERVAGLQATPPGLAPDMQQWRQLAEAGWFRVLLPESHDGLGLDIAALGAIFLAVGEQPVMGPLLDHAITLPLLRVHATGAHAEQIDAALDGASLMALTEALPAGPEHGIRLIDNTLRGTAELVPFGQWADDLLVVARADAGRVIARVDARSMQRTPVACVDPAAQYCRIHFDALPLDRAAILLEGSQADTVLARIRDLQRLMIAAELAGGAQQMVTMSVEYAKTRRQFGRAIGSFQALQHMLAEMTAKAAALHSLVLATVADAAADPRREPELGMIAKAHACTNARELSQDTLQVHGGIGFTAELPLHLYMRRVFTHQGALGESDELLCALGRRLLQQEEWT